MKHKNILITLLAAFGLSVTTACSTVEGFGKDVEALGDELQDASRDADQ